MNMQVRARLFLSWSAESDGGGGRGGGKERGVGCEPNKHEQQQAAAREKMQDGTCEVGSKSS